MQILTWAEVDGDGKEEEQSERSDLTEVSWCENRNLFELI